MTPNGLSAWNYGDGNPLKYTDPTGRVVYPSALAPHHSLLEAAGRAGELQARVDTLRAEVRELQATIDAVAGGGIPTRVWSWEHLVAPSEHMNEKLAELQSYWDDGLLEGDGKGAVHTTGYLRAVSAGLINNEADQSLFLAELKRVRDRDVAKWAFWRALEVGAQFIPAGGGEGALFARTQQSTSVALTELNAAARAAGVSGRWTNVVETMSERAAMFQQKVTGGIAAGTSFIRGGVKFDGLNALGTALLDAKGPGYKNFVDPKTGMFYSWFAGAQSLVIQAKYQRDAALGMRIEWVFAEPEAMQAVRDLFLQNQVNWVTLRVTPP